MSMPNPQNPNDPMYQFIDTQPEDEPPQSPDSSLSHFTTEQMTPENITATLPIVVTITGSNLQNGQAIRATQFISIPFASATGMEQLNNRLFYVQQATADSFQLYDNRGYPVDGRSYSAYIQGGQFTLVGPNLAIVNPSEFPPSGIPAFPPE
jgi:hypothetical protein